MRLAPSNSVARRKATHRRFECRQRRVVVARGFVGRSARHIAREQLLRLKREQLDRIAEAAHFMFADMLQFELALHQFGERT